MKKRKPLKSFDFKGFFVCLDVENILLQYKHRIPDYHGTQDIACVSGRRTSSTSGIIPPRDDLHKPVIANA